MKELSAPPASPAAPRPGGMPYHIDPICPDCGAALVLLDAMEPPKDGIIWYDEFTCPQCRSGIYIDEPGQSEAS